MKIRNLLIVMLSVLLLLSLTGCAAEKVVGNEMGAINGDYGTSNDSMQAPGDYVVKDEAAEESEDSSSLPENRKLIQTVDMTVETENLDTVLQQIDSRIAELGGYVENSNIQNGSAYSGRRYRSATITVRIPAKDVNSFVDRVGEISNIVSSRQTVEDVTLSYVATESRMKALQTEESRLLELLSKAETLDDLLTVEKRLTQVRTELEQVTSALRVFDNQVNYATIHLSITEVTEYTPVEEPETVWERIGAGFKKSLNGVGNFFKEVFVFLVVSSPYMALMAVIGLSILFIIRSSIRRKRRNRAREMQKKDQQDTDE